MKEALSDYSNATKLKVDFYDRERVASWVRSHPSLILWVRDKIGRTIQGWRAYGNWTMSPGGLEEEYILDGHIRIHNSANHKSDGLSAVDGINEIRNILSRPSSSVRLVGLSGVGKTRLLQALFDERIGDNPLNQSQVFYSDITDSPNPDPRGFAERLIALRLRSILAVDNCPPDLHRRLTSVCSAFGSLVSLITVEYDVREDQPEETEVFHLEPASIELIEKVIHKRFSHISQIDSHTIAEFSGGNARIAIALANTIRQGENITNLKDNELFLRLFLQRNESNKVLLKSAEVCSLVYSFDGQTVEGDDAELAILGSLAGMSVSEIYENVSELKRRDLVQQRSIWRAVLPHAVANRLAKRALENIPQSKIINVFERCGSERLLKSFSRRLGYLHDSEIAKEISNKWLSEGGFIGDVCHLNDLGMDIFENIAPIDPESTIIAIERVLRKDGAEFFFSRDNNNYIKITRILVSIAYDKDLFERSCKLLCRFALSESPKENNHSIRKLLKSLFYLYLSGTHATVEQRAGVIKRLVDSNSSDKIELSISLLGASLESWHFTSHHNYEFGTRSRDYGFFPSSREDINHWFKTFIEYVVTLAISDNQIASKAKELLAEKFRGLWIRADMYDDLEIAAKKISSTGLWADGWIAVRNTKRFDGKRMNPETLSRLNDIDKILEPRTLIERAKLYALTSQRNALDLVDAIEDEEERTSEVFQRVEKITRNLGREIGEHYDALKELMPNLLSTDGARLFSFGKGLADACTNPEKIWCDFCEQLTIIDKSQRNYQVLGGFLSVVSEKDTELSEALLNKAVTDEVLASVYPWLQTCVEINSSGIERLKLSLRLDTAPIGQYRSLAYGRIFENISDYDLSELLKLISTKPGGDELAINILEMKIACYPEKDNTSNCIVYAGQELLINYKFSREDKRGYQSDYELANTIRVCFAGESGEAKAKVLCNRLAEAFLNYDIHFMDYGDVLEALAEIQPLVFLDAFLREDISTDYRVGRDLSEYGGDPISKIDDETFIKWCEINPIVRYPIAASAIIPYRKREKDNLLEWTPLALKIIANSSDPIVILEEFKSSLRPMSWSGSRADIMQYRLSLISDLKKHEDALVADWAYKEEKVFGEEIRLEREWELKRESGRNERFE